VLSAEQLRHPDRIPKIQLPLSLGEMVAVRYDAADPRKMVIDVPALQKRALHDYLRQEQQPRGQSPARPGAGIGPPWIVPAQCPNCGAPVDQAKASQDRDPRCQFCQQPVPVRPSGGYQSPVARPAPVPAKPSAPTGGGKWWETTANASGSGPTRRAASGQSSATRPSVTRPAAGLGQQAAVAQTMPQRNVAAKPNYPHRPAGLLLFLAGIVVFAVLAGSHSAWEWAGAAIVLLGLGLFWDKR